MEGQHADKRNLFRALQEVLARQVQLAGYRLLCKVSVMPDHKIYDKHECPCILNGESLNCLGWTATQGHAATEFVFQSSHRSSQPLSYDLRGIWGCLHTVAGFFASRVDGLQYSWIWCRMLDRLMCNKQEVWKAEPQTLRMLSNLLIR